MTDLIQHVDINAGLGHYSHLAPDQLLVTRIFHTLQGEGPHAGKPAVFIRLAGCDRGDKRDCPFCDTFFKVEAGRPMRFVEIEEYMVKEMDLLQERTKIWPMVVLTGGEPMLQNNIVRLIEQLSNLWGTIQIESNGDRLAQDFLSSPECHSVDLIVSPKVIGGEYRRLSDRVLMRANALKFVIDHRMDSPYYAVPDWAFVKDEPTIFLSPLTVYKRAVERDEIVSAWDQSLVDHEATAMNYKRVAYLCKRYGVRASMQQHLFFCEE